MDPEKRKRECEDDDTEKMMTTSNKKKSTEADEVEEEVEEFFAILRRIHEAVKYFEKAEGSGRSFTATATKTWKPSFEVEDFERDNGSVKDPTDDSSGLDLNSEPAVEVPQRNVV